MTDRIDRILQDFEKTVAAASADAVSRLRAISARLPETPIATTAEPDRRLLKLISAGEAARLSGLSKSRVRALCRSHVYGSAPGGFGYRSGGRWLVVSDLFLEFRRSASGSRV